MADQSVIAKVDSDHILPPIEPAAHEAAIDDPEFAAECAALAMGREQRPHKRLCKAIVTYCETWGRVWRADVEYTYPTDLPYILRNVCWRSPEGHPRVWSVTPEIPLFPEELTPPTKEQIAAREARSAQVWLLEPRVRAILLADWALSAAIETAHPNSNRMCAFSLASDLIGGEPTDRMVRFLSFMATEYLGSAGDEENTRAIVEKIAKLVIPAAPSTDSRA